MTLTKCHIKINKSLQRKKMKTTIGIIKEIDKLGRIVIPKEFRERFGFTESVELVATELGILLRNSEYKLVKVNNREKNNNE